LLAFLGLIRIYNYASQQQSKKRVHLVLSGSQLIDLAGEWGLVGKKKARQITLTGLILENLFI